MPNYNEEYGIPEKPYVDLTPDAESQARFNKMASAYTLRDAMKRQGMDTANYNERTLPSGTVVRDMGYWDPDTGDYIRGAPPKEVIEADRARQQESTDRVRESVDRQANRQENFRKKWYPTPEEDKAFIDNIDRVNFTSSPRGKQLAVDAAAGIDRPAEEYKALPSITSGKGGYVFSGEMAKMGVPDVAIPTKPTESGLKDFDEYQKALAPIMAKAGIPPNYQSLNPEEEGLKAAEKAREKWSSHLTDPADPNFKAYHALVTEAQKNAVESAKYTIANGKDITTHFQHFWDKEGGRQEVEKARIANKEAKKTAAYNAIQKVRNSPNSYLLTSEEYDAVRAGGQIPPTAQIKPEILDGLNQLLSSAGMPPLEQTVDTIPGVKYHKEWPIVGGNLPFGIGQNKQEDPTTRNVLKGKVTSPVAAPSKAIATPTPRSQYTIGQVVDVPGKGKHKYIGNNQWQPLGQ